MYSNLEEIFYFKGSVAIILLPTIDMMRIWMGPLPDEICTFSIMARNYYFSSIVMVYSSLTVIKFIVLCILKRVPEMDDDFAAKCIIRTIVIICLLLVGTKFWNGEKPDLQKVKMLAYQNFFILKKFLISDHVYGLL